MTQNSVSTRPFDPFVFWISASVTIAFVLWSIVFPDNMGSVINGIFNWTTTVWARLYLITVFFLVMGCFVLMGPKYGAMKHNCQPLKEDPGGSSKEKTYV